jgi:sugar fermentation stimulation protein A
MSGERKGVSDPLRISLGTLQEGIVVDRPNRFVANVRLDVDSGGIPSGGVGGHGDGCPACTRGIEVACHVADSGRLKELLVPGNRVMVRSVFEQPDGVAASPEGPKVSRRKGAEPRHCRKTSYDMVLALHGNTWVSVDTRYPTRLFGQALRARAIPEFREYEVVRAEYPFHRLVKEPEGVRKTPRSRLDFYLEGDRVAPALVEVKSVTLCADGLGLFPDAPTDRGARHLGELQSAVGLGYRAFAVFIAQREDIVKVAPNRDTDPKFASALTEARDAGVCLLAYRCKVSPEAIVFEPTAIPVIA